MSIDTRVRVGHGAGIDPIYRGRKGKVTGHHGTYILVDLGGHEVGFHAHELVTR